MAVTQLSTVAETLRQKQAAPGTPPVRPSSSTLAACGAECPICGGVGYVRIAPDANPGEPNFGKLAACPNAQRLELQEKLTHGVIDPRLGMTRGELSLTWEVIKDGLSDGHKAREAVRRAFDLGHGMVFLYGASGQAKTLALKIAVATALREGLRAAYANMLTVLDDIRRAFDERENKQTELVRRMEWWIGLDILAIDELDKTNSTDWAKERMFQLIDARYQRAVRQEALTIIAANYDGTDELSPYLRSRIEDNRFMENGMVVRLDGPDGRKAVPSGWMY
ncbi:MAG: AAA family ATPase [Chloroflexota bacterium]